jgi:hypothetical protein
MREVDRDLCRKAATECVELARVTADPERKQILLTRAQEWLKLAYSRHEQTFEQLLAQFNSEQMEFRAERPPLPPPIRRQDVQQPQKKIEDKK